jgi:hypothetical protein
MVAVSDSVQDLKEMANTISEHCEDGIVEIHCHAVKEIVKDVYGGVANGNAGKDSDGNHEQSAGSGTEGEA